MVARLVEQKGVELVVRSGEPLAADKGRSWSCWARATRRIIACLHELRTTLSRTGRPAFGFDEPLAHQIEAGADLFLMPSLYEPSGLNQLYSSEVRHGAGGAGHRRSGGHRHRLHAADAGGGRPRALSSCPITPDGPGRHEWTAALDLYRDQPDKWLRLMRPACGRTGPGTAAPRSTSGCSECPLGKTNSQ